MLAVSSGTSLQLSGSGQRRLQHIHLDYDEWHNFLGNRAMVDALLSRLRHYCHTVRINGPSLRDPQG